MGIKLIYRSCLFVILLSACTSTKNRGSNDFSIKEEDYIKSYKIAFVCGCINEGTKENFTRFMLDNKDLGLFTEAEVISHQRVNEADSVGRVYSRTIKPLNYEDAGDKKPYVSRCIYFALGREVPSFAKVSYQGMLKAK